MSVLTEEAVYSIIQTVCVCRHGFEPRDLQQAHKSHSLQDKRSFKCALLTIVPTPLDAISNRLPNRLSN